MLATIAVVPWLTWMFAPSLLQKVVSDSLPDALFASNWVYIFRKVPYFEAAGLPSPLTHLWFLGVTMQFYLVWPLLMVVLGKITKSKWVRSMAILVIMAASTADMVLLFDPANTSRVYYGTDTRLAELAAGALLAIWIAPSSRGTEAAEAGAASQTVQIERQAGDKTGAHYRLQCSWHRGFGGTADRILVRQRVSVVHVPRRVPDYRVHIVVRLGLCREQ
jgi:peptidoglycan/LPS O-acetylase OafA/YrhL